MEHGEERGPGCNTVLILSSETMALMSDEQPVDLTKACFPLVEHWLPPLRAVKTRTSAVVIVSNRRWPKKGATCLANRSATTRSERRRFVW